MKSQPWWLVGLGVVVFMVIFLAPFADTNPDGLERVAQDQGFQAKETPSIAQKSPFSQIFDEYALRGIDNPVVAKALAGLGGCLVVGGITWGLGWWLRRRRSSP